MLPCKPLSCFDGCSCPAAGRPAQPPAAHTSAAPAPTEPDCDTSAAANTLAAGCQVTEPEWAKPDEDAAVDGAPAFGYYYINPDRSIWASAWWSDEAKYHLRSGEEGNKMGWFRPAGAELEITGRRLDGEAPELTAEFPCCYPTRFQASGLYFPTEGCWEVTARAEESVLTFVVWVVP